MKRPSFQFYPADWQSNKNLMRCTWAEKGMWVSIMCLMHDSDDAYGLLRWTLADIAEAIGVKEKDLSGLVRKGVLKGSDSRCAEFIYIPRSGRKDGDPVTLVPEQDGPIWFSSRMVTDDHKARVREKNLPPSPSAGAPKDCKGEPKSAHLSDHPSDHPSREGAPAAPSSSSSTSKAKASLAGGELTGNELKDLGDRCLETFGLTPQEFMGHFGPIRDVLAIGCTPEDVIEICRRIAARPGFTLHGNPIALLAKAARDEYAKLLTERRGDATKLPDEEVWRGRLAGFRERKVWSGMWGPKPTDFDCEAPRHLLIEFGYLEVSHA